MSSSCSSIDLGIDPDFDDILTESLVNDIEAFVHNTNRLKNALDGKSYFPDGETKCVQVHAALSMVSQSVRDLLKYSTFKTSQVLIPASQLVHCVKEITFDTSNIDASRSLQAIERLELAIGNSLKHSVNGRSVFSSVNQPPPKSSANNWAKSGIDQNNYSSSTGPVRPGGHAGGGIASAAVQLLNGMLSLPPAENGYSRGGHPSQTTNPMPTKMPHQRLTRRHSAFQSDKISAPVNGTLLLPNLQQNNSEGAEFGSQQHCSTAAADSATARLMRDLLVGHHSGLEMAFDRCKAWSKYAAHLLSFVRNRLNLEHDHHKACQKLAEQTKAMLAVDANNNFLPLVDIFKELMEGAIQFTNQADQTISMLNQKFISTLENRQKEHDTKRRKLKGDWSKQRKLLDVCAEELRRARQNLNTKEGGYLKARDSTLRHEQSVPPPSMGILSNSADPQKKRKELEKKRKSEEDALNRKTDAENEVLRLERELDGRRISLEQLRVQIISELCDLIRHCDLTTTACASHFFKSFSNLFAPLPSDYDKLAYAIRSESTPGAAFMSFLQSQKFPARSVSTSSLPRGDKCGGSTEDDSAQQASPHRFHSSSQMASAPSACSSSTASNFVDGVSPSTATRRRNALNADEHYDLIAETSHRRQKKSMTRLFEQSSTSIVEPSDAAKTHQLQRTRQVTKCAQCDHYVVFDALKCSTCGIVWHKKCLNSVAVFCGTGALAEDSSMAQRRMSIFGVPLRGHLEAQRRKVPLILEKCIDELQKRGMTCKGLYRTCGVKSKIEQICVFFEQKGNESEVDLSDVHPMNMASVIKLYLRRLPEPLMTFELYKECTGNGSFDVEADCSTVLQGLRDIVSRLPQQNYDTLKFLILHLKRVTWFELDNLMTASNLAAVIAPSLIWQRAVPISDCSSFINDAHGQTKFVELLIQNAFEVFFVDRAVDWQEFFETYKDVREPKLVDPDMEADIVKKANLELEDEVDQLEEEEEYDICDEYTEMPSGSTPHHCSHLASSSSNNDSGMSIENIQTRSFVPTNYAGQPPLPPNTARRQMESSSDDLEQDCTALPRRYYPSSTAYKKNSSPAAVVSSVVASTEPSASTPRVQCSSRRGSKQRSFTTSILVSPRSDRKCAILPAKQHSVDGPVEGDLSGQRKFSDTARSYQRLEHIEDIKKAIPKVDRLEQKRSLCSGEVVVDIKKDQFCSPNYSSGRGARTGKLSSASFSTAQSPTLSTAFPLESGDGVEAKTLLINKTRRRRLERSTNNGGNIGSEDRDQQAVGCISGTDSPYSPSLYSHAANNNNNHAGNAKAVDFTTLQSAGVIFSGSDVSYV